MKTQTKTTKEKCKDFCKKKTIHTQKQKMDQVLTKKGYFGTKF